MLNLLKNLINDILVMKQFVISDGGKAYTGPGKIFNSDFLNGLKAPE